MSRPYSTAANVIKQYLPAFCWQTTREISSFIKQHDKKINTNSIDAVLSRMVRDGFIVARPVKPKAARCWWRAREYRWAA